MDRRNTNLSLRLMLDQPDRREGWIVGEAQSDICSRVSSAPARAPARATCAQVDVPLVHDEPLQVYHGYFGSARC